MDREGVLATKPEEPATISTVEELLKYQKDFDTGFHFTDKEAEIILDYMEGHGYAIGQVDGVLYRGDLCDKPDETVWEEFPMDDVIDSVCEWNYEFILDIDAERQNARDFIDFGNKQNRYDMLKSQEQVLDKLFDQTKYAVVIEKTAERLANEFLANLSKGQNMDSAVKDLTSVIIQPQAKGKAR
ncbi:multidrug transporter [Enterocloster bolteae]|uniref:multidrug transporter n=1 Tax=Enterocloster bolteae TaxID=208479 RepID=UPI00210CE92A|nr:multidrug transporter [Enterocloster bolteae]MCQ4756926.1 multidrug transporter [Enterocloster bolteae]